MVRVTHNHHYRHQFLLHHPGIRIPPVGMVRTGKRRAYEYYMQQPLYHIILYFYINFVTVEPHLHALPVPARLDLVIFDFQQSLHGQHSLFPCHPETSLAR